MLFFYLYFTLSFDRSTAVTPKLLKFNIIIFIRYTVEGVQDKIV